MARMNERSYISRTRASRGTEVVSLYVAADTAGALFSFAGPIEGKLISINLNLSLAEGFDAVILLTAQKNMGDYIEEVVIAFTAVAGDHAYAFDTLIRDAATITIACTNYTDATPTEVYLVMTIEALI